MINKNILLVIGVVLLLLLIGGVIGIIMIKKNKDKEIECSPISGGAFHLLFETNGGEEISSMHVGIGVSPDSYDDLPVPSKEGSVFDGWYYDKELKEKVDVTNSRDIPPKGEFDKHGCLIGHKDITLYAKWK